MGRKAWFLFVLLSLLLLNACGPEPKDTTHTPFTNDIRGNDVSLAQHPTPAPPVVIHGHTATPTPTPVSTSKATPKTGEKLPPTPTNIPRTGTGAAPYGQPPPITALEIELTQKLFAVINSDRAARGLYPYTWNETLAGGARLHSWNMYHCGFSHTCPEGIDQCERIAKQGFPNLSDCGENIAYAGPFPTPWEGVYKIQQTMVNEPPTGWHRIHLFSTTLHRIGVGVYVDPDGYIWFTEDMVS